MQVKKQLKKAINSDICKPITANGYTELIKNH